MATYEVFVPVQGEFIVTVEANSEAEAIRLITDGEIDFVTEGEPNVEMVSDDTNGPAPVYATLIDGAEGDLDDDDDDDEMSYSPIDSLARVDRSVGITRRMDTAEHYVMRHFKV